MLKTVRPLVAALTTLVLGAGMLVGSSAAQAATTPSDLDAQVASALAEVNKIRKSKGLKSLKLNCAINDVSQAWSGKQADSETMKHNPNYGSQIPGGWSRAGETVAAGQSSFASAVSGPGLNKSWLNSAAHYKILTGDYTHVGFGMARDSRGKAYYTANFAKYSGSLSDFCEPVDDGSLPGRIAGVDRYQTASYITSVWDWDQDAEIVFLATGENYPDALSAAAAAVKMGAPVLLTAKKKLPSEVKSRLRTLDPDRVVVLGSTAAISNGVVDTLRSMGFAVTRLGGTDRYDTMRKIVRYAWSGGTGGALVDTAPTVVVATGENFPDALSAGPAAASEGGAVVLVKGKASSIPSATLSLIDQLKPGRIVIAGSSSVVSSSIERQLIGRYGSVVRLAGPDRYDTSRRVVAHFFDEADAVFFATGKNFPDALAGAALAGSLGAPLLVTAKSCVTSSTKSLVLSLGPSARVLLGSTTVISSGVASLKTC